MSSIKNTLFMLVLMVGALSAKANTVEPHKESIQFQIKEMLKGVSFSEYADQSVKVMITFTVTSKNEIMVIATNNSDLDATLKNNLNYKVVDTDLEKYKVYSIPLTIN